MKTKNMTLMAVAIGCGLVAAFLTAKLSGGSAPETVDVIVAKKELVVGTVLDEKELESMLATQKFQKSNLPPDIINSADELKNKKLNRTLKPGNFFSTGDVGADSGVKLPEGMFKYAIKIDNVKAVSGFVQPGDKVDVILTESMQNGKARSGMVLRDMLVLAVDTQNSRPEGGAARLQVNAVALAVSPTQSLALSSAEKRGEVKLLLRDPKNLDHHDIPTVSRIPGIDIEEAAGQPVVAPGKTVSVVITKAEVPENTHVTESNFNEFFITKEVPEEGVLSDKTIKDQKNMLGKYVIKKLDADVAVHSTWLSDDKNETARAEPPKDDLEVLPPPHEIAQEKPLYPRKFMQIINNQQVFFIEVKQGEFRRVDAGADLKDLPDSQSKPEPKEQKTEGNHGDRAA